MLSDLNLTLVNPQLLAVIGKIGSGKTSLLLTIIKEVPRFSGIFYLNPEIKIAYVE